MVFAVADTTSKYLSTGMPIVEIQWIRYILFAAMAVVLAALARRTGATPQPDAADRSWIMRDRQSVLFVYGSAR